MTTSTAATARTSAPARAALLDAAKVALAVVAPMLAQGVIRRRPRMVRRLTDAIGLIFATRTTAGMLRR